MSNEINPMAFFQEPSVADLRLLACPGAEELTALIDKHLVEWAKSAGVEKDSFIILFFQLVVGTLCGDHADAQIPRQPPDGGQGFVRLQFPSQDLVFDLGVKLLVDRRAAFVVDEKIHGVLPPFHL